MAKDETDLLNRLQKRDPGSMEELVRRHTKHLFKACLGLGFTDVEAEDLTRNSH